MLYAGMDIHKNFSQCVLMTEKGEILKEEKVTNESENITTFFDGSDEQISIAMEATTNYRYFYDILVERGYKVHLAHPLKTRYIAEERVKTDKIDARALADLLRGNLLPESYVRSKDIEELREIVHKRITLGRQRSDVKNQILAELRKRNIKYDCKTAFNKKGLKWLEELDIGTITFLLPVFNVIEEQCKQLEKAIEIGGRKYKQIGMLTSVPGVGVYSAAIIFTEIGDIERFPSEGKFFSFTGLTPSVYQSGETIYHGRLTRQGNKIIRWILVQAIQSHRRYCPGSKISKFYNRLAKKKPNNVAKIAAARKLAQAIYHMLKNNDNYRVKG